MPFQVELKQPLLQISNKQYKMEYGMVSLLINCGSV
jgi:hypothetical protein